MTLNQRRLLYIFFILLFIVITPLICLYAAGYSVNKNFSVEKTGILIIDSEPRGAEIYLNDKIQQTFFKKYFSQDQSYIKTPAKIKNLRPGDYKISLKTEGYWPWEKKLSIQPGESTFAEDIYLFKNDLPTLAVKGVYSELVMSPDKKNLAAFNNNKAVILNLNNEQIDFYASSSTSPVSQLNTNISWSPDEENLILGQYVFNINNWANPLILSDIIGIQKNIKWGDNNNTIFYNTQNGLYQYDINAKINDTIINENGINDYLLIDNNIYYTKLADHTAELNIFSLKDYTIIKKIKLPYSTYIFLNQKNKFVNLYDTAYNILYLIDPFSDLRPLRETVNNVNKTFWINDNKLLYANDFEIWTLDLVNFKKELLTRISSKINKIIWHPNNNYVIYSTDNSINTIELDDREKRNITNLIELDVISGLQINGKGDTLYFYSKIGNQEGIYKLSI
ncbi:hypothetical protein DRH27_00470 [Candidatus Falkowbacteria bacterium]|nr:MAG: hypothetical protein DRH27_00470 [Candidatus Falkowbacteria bacterium]